MLHGHMQRTSQSPTWNVRWLAGALVIMGAVVPLSASGRVFGIDERELPSAYSFSAIEKDNYSSIARIECPNPMGGEVFATAFHVGSFRTMVTTAHSFYVPNTSQKLDPHKCSAAFYNTSGALIERLAIVFISSRWDDKKYFRDPSNDLAIVVLSDISQTSSRRAPVALITDRTTTLDVTMVGFNYAVKEPSRLSKVKGRLYWRKSTSVFDELGRKFGFTVSNANNFPSVDYDSGHGTSGAPVYNQEMKIIGMDQGYGGNQSTSFDQDRSFNTVIIFDERLRRDMDAVLTLFPEK